MDKFVVCQEGLLLSPAVMPDRVARGTIARSGIQTSVRRKAFLFKSGAHCASADVLVPRSARSLAALVWGDGSGCGAVQENLPLSFQTVCSKAAWPDLETRHQCAEGAACSLVAMDYETGVRFCSVGLFGIAKRCLFLLPLGEGGPKDRMRGGGITIVKTAGFAPSPQPSPIGRGGSSG